MMRANEIRKSFLDFFCERGHTLVQSSPLISDDPSLLFTIAGMVQFKKYFSGEVPLPYKRATSCQKCLRLSDVENVGHSVKYHTFLEMLGNFSFGDYFKLEAIKWAWEYLTEISKLKKDKLYISVFKEDDEAYNIWRDEVGVESERIFRLVEEDNFWGPAGTTGACGPSSEIYYDFGEEKSCGKPDCTVGCECDRYVEIWNLVFPQFDQQEDGSRPPLKNRGIDTGLGFERLVTILQDTDSNFKTDLFKPIIEEIERIFGIRYSDATTAMDIISDHIRGIVFASSEGVVPSNEGRGYVLRRILRRALRQARILNIKEPFLYRLVGVVVDVMREPYPELVEKREQSALLIKSEEERFLSTLDKGINIFEEIADRIKQSGKSVIPGEEVFRLYDTYGFPLDLTKEMASEHGLTVDLNGFESEMTHQKERARAQAKFEETKSGGWKTYREAEESEFVGYEQISTEANIVKWRMSGEKAELILDRTPFYGEAGGQIGDTGLIYSQSFKLNVEDTKRTDNFTVHIGKVEGEIKDEKVTVEVDKNRRMAIARSHTSTHILHYALRRVLGTHVKQEGSLVEDERFRFDFTHFNPLSEGELKEIEMIVNEKVVENHRVETEIMPLDRAKKEGAIALFGEKYADSVRVVKTGDFSKELCGGTHLSHTGEVGLFKIVNETAVAAGVRRIEAKCGKEAYLYVRAQEDVLKRMAKETSVPVMQLPERFHKLLTEKKYLEDELKRVEGEAITKIASDLIGKAKKIGEISIVSSKVQVRDMGNVRTIADIVRTKLEKVVGVLGCENEGRARFLVFVSDNLKEKYNAGAIAKEIAGVVGGKGGGKPTIAEAGGKDVAKIDEALKKIYELV